MKLKKLLKNLPHVEVKGSKEIEIGGITSDSRLVAPGNLFVARKGFVSDGAQFIPAAIAAGAVAIATDLYDPSLRHVTQIIAPDLATLEGDLATEFYEHPSRELFTVGITGTNGKTTISFMVKHLLDELNFKCGLLGTIGQVVGDAHFHAPNTTLDVISNHKALREMIRHDCQACVMEVTSHGLDQGRVRHIDFDIGIFSNLSQDHLDYHHTMEEYAAAKAKLFSQTKQAIINCDDPSHTMMGSGITYGLRSSADIYATDITLTPDSTTFTVHAPDSMGERQGDFTIPLIGRFNIYNALATIAVGIVRGASLHQIAEIMETIPQIPGRLEKVENPAGAHIYVDFAHTPEALRSAISTLREVHKGKLITLFGCGGNRDASKRTHMGQIAFELADHTIVTSDNPRTEEPAAICQQIVADLSASSKWEVVVDRAEAIAHAVNIAKRGDVILIAGKGHETTQIIGTRSIPFDDRKIATQACFRK